MYLDLLLDVVNGVGGLDIKCDGLAREGFHENLHVYRRSHRAIAKEIERDARWPPKTKPGPLTNQERGRKRTSFLSALSYRAADKPKRTTSWSPEATTPAAMRVVVTLDVSAGPAKNMHFSWSGEKPNVYDLLCSAPEIRDAASPWARCKIERCW
jgi:hypothetical protein